MEAQKQAESFALTTETVSDKDQVAWVQMMEQWHDQEHLPLSERTAKNPYSVADQKDGTSYSFSLVFFLLIFPRGTVGGQGGGGPACSRTSRPGGRQRCAYGHCWLRSYGAPATENPVSPPILLSSYSSLTLLQNPYP